MLNFMRIFFFTFTFTMVHATHAPTPASTFTNTNCEGDDEFLVVNASRCLKLEQDNDDLMGAKAAGVCERAGGAIANTLDENYRYALMQAVEKQCQNNICPYVCVHDDYPQSIGLEQNPWYLRILNRPKNPQPWMYEPKRIAVTEPMKIGDAIFLALKLHTGSLDVFELTDSVVEQMREGSQASLIFQLAIYRDFIDAQQVPKNGLFIRTGYLERQSDSLKVDGLVNHTFPIEPTTDGKMYTIKIHMAQGRTIISAPGLLAKVWSFETPEPSGRMYLSRDRHGTENELVDVYIMKGGFCRKSMYLETVDTKTINCHWTMSTQSIPSYLCERSQFVACQFPTNATGLGRKQEKNGNEFFNGLFKCSPGFVLCFTIFGTVMMSGSMILKFFGKGKG